MEDIIFYVRRNKKDTTTRKWRWLQELKQEREKDIRTETI